MSKSQEEKPMKHETLSPSSGKSKVVIQELPIQIDPSLNTVWVDSMNIMEYEESQTTTLFFHTAVLFPIDSMRRQEVARLQMTKSHACKIIDAMARHLDYYPKKVEESKDDHEK